MNNNLAMSSIFLRMLQPLEISPLPSGIWHLVLHRRSLMQTCYVSVIYIYIFGLDVCMISDIQKFTSVCLDVCLFPLSYWVCTFGKNFFCSLNFRLLLLCLLYSRSKKSIRLFSSFLLFPIVSLFHLRSSLIPLLIYQL